jgi:hypothetical protein
MAAPAIDDLSDATRFERIATFRHSNPSTFLQEYFHAYMWRPTSPIAIYWALNFAALILIGVEWSQGRHGMNGFGDFGFGVLLAFAFMPLHEALHGVVYKFFGARDVRYQVLWRKAMAYAIAHRFVATRRAFFWVAIAPSLVINPALLTYAYLAPARWRLTILCALFVHVAFTSGDFALINFFYVHRRREPVTYDDFEEGVSYFYVEAPSVEEHSQV